MLVLGGLDDQLSFLIWTKVSESVFQLPSAYSFYQDKLWGFIRPFATSRPLFSFLSSVLGTLLGSYAYPLLIVVSITLGFYFVHRFFGRRRYTIGYALLFVFSAYFWNHYDIHLPLAQLWLVPLLLMDLKKRCVLLIGFLFAASLAVSNYIGFFLLIYFTLYSFLKFIYEKDWRYVKKFAVVSALTALFSLPFLFPFIRANYIRPPMEVVSTVQVVQRPYEDFFHFSSRPWYFFIPPVKNPWLGEVGQKMVARLEATNYFLADDYFPGEHSANYFGLIFLISVTVLSILVLRSDSSAPKKKITFYWVLNFLLYLFMLPPFFTISGIKIYTPGELMYRFFPMFRVTTRMAPLLLLNFLIILATSVDYLSRQSEKYKKFFRVFVPVLTLITLAETFIPPKIVYYNEPPAVYSYLGEIASQKKFAVYPYSQTDEAFFWLDAHKAYLLNLRGYSEEVYNTEVFTKSLPTLGGISILGSLGGEYLVVYRDIPKEEFEFFSTTSQLVRVKEFPNSVIYKVVK
ncbi:hypothetical protein GF360_02390 [candidate division WWE3 bacterium]|nr:hypothetical protein [candidate division WWE3 bacterium]